jgi:hypothetical protein
MQPLSNDANVIIYMTGVLDADSARGVTGLISQRVNKRYKEVHGQTTLEGSRPLLSGGTDENLHVYYSTSTNLNFEGLPKGILFQNNNAASRLPPALEENNALLRLAVEYFMHVPVKHMFGMVDQDGLKRAVGQKFADVGVKFEKLKALAAPELD